MKYITGKSMGMWFVFRKVRIDGYVAVAMCTKEREAHMVTDALNKQCAPICPECGKDAYYVLYCDDEKCSRYQHG